MAASITDRHGHLWRSLAEEENDAARRVEGLVGITVWSRSPSDRWWIEPLKGFRSGYRPGRDLAKPPRRRHDVEELGYDTEGRLVRGRLWLSEEVSQSRYVAFGADAAEVREFASAGGLRSVSRLEFEEDRVKTLAFAMRSPWTYVEERFSYDEQGRLAIVAFERHNEDTMSVESWRALAVGEQLLEYDGDAVVAVHERYASDEPTRRIYPPAE